MPKVFVISLERSVERRLKFVEENKRLNFSFFSAIDGERMSDEEIRRSGYFGDDLRYTKGAYGCALSHLSLWDSAIFNHRPVTIAEDDAVFREDFDTQYALAMAKLPPEWDFVLWGWNFDAALSFRFLPGVSPAVAFFDQQQMRTAVEQFKVSDEIVCLPRLDKCWGIVAYTVSASGARKLKEECFPLKDLEIEFPIIRKFYGNTGIDAAMNAAYGALNGYLAFPPLAITLNDRSMSTVQRDWSIRARVFERLRNGWMTTLGRRDE